MELRFSIAVGMLIGLTVSSCYPARRPCLTACAKDKDGCMIAATTVDQIQACDVDESRCGTACP
jgi:hypothetical protein